MTLNSLITLILHYFSEFDSFGGRLRQSINQSINQSIKVPYPIFERGRPVYFLHNIFCHFLPKLTTLQRGLCLSAIAELLVFIRGSSIRVWKSYFELLPFRGVFFGVLLDPMSYWRTSRNADGDRRKDVHPCESAYESWGSPAAKTTCRNRRTSNNSKKTLKT